MFENVKKLLAVMQYSAPSDAKIIPATIIPGQECIEVITSGKVFFDAGTGVRTYGKGTVFWHLPGEKTIFMTPPEDPYRCMAIRFAVIRPTRPCGRVGIWNPPENAVDFVNQLFRQFHSGAGDPDMLCMYAYSALAWHSSLREKNSDESYPAPLRAAIDFIMKNFQNPVSSEDIASAAGTSQPYLFSLFRKYLGTSPHRYVLKLRLAKAKQLLAEHAISIKEVVADCGFYSTEVFYRQFKSAAGITPAEYRKKYTPYMSNS